MANPWITTTASSLKRHDVFRYPGEEAAAVITARWDENGEVRFLSQDFTTLRSQGLSILNPATPVEIRE